MVGDALGLGGVSRDWVFQRAVLVGFIGFVRTTSISEQYFNILAIK
jgi:hypothetical protein